MLRAYEGARVDLKPSHYSASLLPVFQDTILMNQTQPKDHSRDFFSNSILNNDLQSDHRTCIFSWVLWDTCEGVYFVQIISETPTSSTIRNICFYKTRTLDEGLVQWLSGLSACCIHMMTWVPTLSTQVKKIQWCTCNPHAGRAETDGPLKLTGQPA